MNARQMGRAVALVTVITVLALSTKTVAAATYGLRAGLVEARLHGGIDEIIPDYRAGFAAGTWLRVPLGGGFSIQPELQFIQKGGQGDFHFGGYVTGYDFSLSYLEAPVLLHFAIPTRGAWSPYLVLGPAAALRVDDQLDIEIDPRSLTTPGPPNVHFATIFEDVGTFRNVRDWDFVMVGGAGVVVGRGPFRIAADLRYERGFRNVHHLSGDWSKNGAFAATLGVEFH